MVVLETLAIEVILIIGLFIGLSLGAMGTPGSIDYTKNTEQGKQYARVVNCFMIGCGIVFLIGTIINIVRMISLIS